MLERPRLTSLLAQQLDDHEAVVLIGAPGSGKTTLCAEFARGHGGRVSWLVLDRASRQPVEFLAALASALGEQLPRPGVGATRQLASIATDLALGLGSASRLIVLDDCDALASAEDVNAILAAFSDHLPAGAKMLFTARGDLPHTLGERIARSRITAIDDETLAFSVEEIKSLAASRGLRPEQAETISARTHGWPIAVDLLAAGGAETGARLASLERFVVSEILEPLSGPERAFVLRSAVMDRLTTDLVDSVLGEQALSTWRSVRGRRLPTRREAGSGISYVPVFKDILREHLKLDEPRAVARLDATYRHAVAEASGSAPLDCGSARLITVQTFGPDRDIRVDGRSCNIKRFKVIEFAALLASSGSRLHRSAAQRALFPEADPGHASNYFRQVLFQFRTHTGIEFRHDDHGYLQLPDGVAIATTDQQVECALAQAHHRRDGAALDSLRDALHGAGEYLTDSDLEWAEMRRFEVDTVVEHARLFGARLALDLGRPDAARELANAALETDADCEAAWQILVGLGASVDEPDASAVVAKRLRRVKDAFGAARAE